MKKDIPMGAIVAAIIGVLAVAGIVIFFAIQKSDPASQAPNPPPTFNPAQKAAESRGLGPSLERGPPSANGEPNKPAPVVQ